MSRIVNIKYRCCGYNFDAAVDCDWELHDYDERRDDVTSIELYNLDDPAWNIRMIYQSNRNDQLGRAWEIKHTFVDLENIIKETRKWVHEMKRKSKKTNHNNE